MRKSILPPHKQVISTTGCFSQYSCDIYSNVQLFNLFFVYFSERETVQRQIVVEDVEENISEEGVHSDFSPTTVREVIVFLDIVEEYNTIYCPQSRKHRVS